MSKNRDKQLTVRRQRTLQQQPNEQMRHRAFAAAICRCAPQRISDTTLAAIDAIRAELLACVPTEHQVEFITRYFGLGRNTFETTDQIMETEGVARTTVINCIGRAIRAMHEYLQEAHPYILEQVHQQILQDDPTFWDRVDRSGECWLWTGAIDLGYGVVKRGGKKWQATRYAYHLTHGNIKRGMFIIHSCGNRACVRPDHLYEGEPGDWGAHGTFQLDID